MNLRKLFDAQEEVRRQSSPTKTRFAEFFYGHRHGATILLVIIIALTVRLVAINHGFPYIYHSDEPTIVRCALSIRFDLNTHHFDWPHLYIYLNYFIYMVFAKFRDLITLAGLKPLITQIASIVYNDNLIFYLITRVFSAVLGAFTLVPIYLWVKKLVNKNAGLWAAALLALTPLHVRYSHYTLIDVPMLFFLSWSLFFSTFSPILSGLFLGFSASTKYNGILGGLFIALYYLLCQSKPLVKRVGDVVKLGIFTIIGFLIGTPYALLDYKTFTRTDGPQGAFWQFTNLGNVEFFEQVGQFINALANKLPDNLGYGVMVLFAVGVISLLITIVKKKHVDRFPLLCTLIFLFLVFYVSGLKKDRSHYYMITYPYIFLVAGWMLNSLIDRIKKATYKTIVVVLVFSPSLILSIYNIVDLENKRSIEIFGGDIKENVKMF